MTGLLLALLLLAGFKRKNALVGIPFKAFAFLAKKHALELGDLPLEIVNLAFIPQRLLLGLTHLFLHLSQAAIRRLLRGTACFFLLLKKVNKLLFGSVFQGRIHAINIRKSLYYTYF